jgi:hypothetical protein
MSAISPLNDQCSSTAIRLSTPMRAAWTVGS